MVVVCSYKVLYFSKSLSEDQLTFTEGNRQLPYLLCTKMCLATKNLRSSPNLW